MTLQGSNFGHQVPTNFGSYLANTHQLTPTYQPNHPPSYPIFHPAAVAAVAAAAAGYSHQFNTNVINRPLNLTANHGAPNSHPFYSTDATRASYYANIALQQSGMVPRSGTSINTHNYNDVTSHEHLSTTSSDSSVVFPSHPNTSSNYLASTTVVAPQIPHQTPPRGNLIRTPSSKASTTKPTSKSSGIRHKKASTSEEAVNRKRQEFNELIKARTEKLMTDGPVCAPPLSGPFSSSSSAASGEPDSTSPNYRKLIHAVMDAKKLTLLRSPSVIRFLDNQQRSLGDFKRQTELFCVNVNR